MTQRTHQLTVSANAIVAPLIVRVDDDPMAGWFSADTQPVLPGMEVDSEESPWQANDMFPAF
jgi:hypothetical protein